jgi:hypothetical protein
MLFQESVKFKLTEKSSRIATLYPRLTPNIMCAQAPRLAVLCCLRPSMLSRK